MTGRIPARRRAAVLSAAALAATIVAVPPAGADEHDASTLGAFSAPFEEGGATVPRCEETDDGLVCKPTAVTSVVLPDGRVLYWNGIEGSENNEYAIVPEGGRTARDARARVLDLRGAQPAFTTPDPDGGGATNPNIDDEPDPAGVLGVPGRPGDGLVGSIVGQIADDALEQEPTDPPDDSWANDGDLFCTDQVHLADGRLLIAGGTDWYSEPGVPEDVPEAGGLGIAELEGLRNTRLFDAATDTFAQAGDMKYGRWYPTTVIMPDGKVLVAGGVTKLLKSTQGSQVRRTETFDPTIDKWTENFTSDASESSLPLFARLHLMPNGKVFYGGVGQTFGPMGQAVDEALWSIQQLWNDETKAWEQVGPAPFGTRGGAFSVMLPLKPDDAGDYPSGTLLVGGGTLLPTPGSFAALPITEEVTVTGDEVASEQVGDLSNARWFSSAVVLPTGEVAAFSGADKDEVVAPGMEAPVRQAELYDPQTKEWSPLATGARDRTYHNTAVLLPDMRVLVGGHSPISTFYGAHRDAAPGVTANNDKDPSFEIYSPPYLFRGPRPRIEKVQAAVAYGETFRVTTGDTKPADIESVVMMRLPSLTHIVDPNQRSVELSFTKKSNGIIEVSAPPGGAVAPPGHYYLVINRKGDEGAVPSAARIVRLDEAGNITDQEKRAEAPEPMPGTEGDPSVDGDATEPEDTSVPAQLAGGPEGGADAAVLPELSPASSRRSGAASALPLLAAAAVAIAGVAAVPLGRARPGRWRRRPSGL